MLNNDIFVLVPEFHVLYASNGSTMGSQSMILDRTKFVILKAGWVKMTTRVIPYSFEYGLAIQDWVLYQTGPLRMETHPHHLD